MENVYFARREKLAALLPEDDGALIFSGEEIPLGVDMMYPFHVDKNFYYLTGLDMPGAAVYIARGGSLLFLPPYSPKREAYEGPQETTEQLCARAGFDVSAHREALPPERILDSLPRMGTLHLDLQRPPVDCFAAPARRLAAVAAERGLSTENVYRKIYKLRSVKDSGEISRIRRAVDITGESLSYMAKNCRAGMYEYEWQAAFEYNMRRHGCDTSFTSIVASGKNAVYLHYEKNNAIVNNGELFLFDVGVYYDHYASDISRTYPVGGVFTKRQREIYELVYDATRLVLDKMKPHRPYRDHVDALTDYFGKYVIPLHIVDTEIEKENFLRSLSRGCCHHLGLDAHDAYAELDDELLPGMVFTNEPGVYLKNEGIGVRIEEDLLITEDGNELLSCDIPAAPDDILDLLN